MAGGGRRCGLGRACRRLRPARPACRPRHDRHRGGAVRGRDRLLPPNPGPAGGHHPPGNPHHPGSPRRWAGADASPPEVTDPQRSPTPVVLGSLAPAAFPPLLGAIGRAVTVMGEHAPYSRDRKQYLAGRLDGARITALIDGGDELLVSLTPATDESQAASGPPDKVFRVTASECSLDR